ncbi:MAG: PTS sugar transporter subunit IIA [Acidobacteriota bacterium]
MRLAAHTRRDLVFPSLPGFDDSTVLRALARRIALAGVVDDANSLYDALWEREQLGSTGLGHGVAVPHCKLKKLESVVLAIGWTEQEIDFGALDGRPTRLFFTVLSPVSQPAAHLRCLASISRWLSEPARVERLLRLDRADDILLELESAEDPEPAGA